MFGRTWEWNWNASRNPRMGIVISGARLRLCASIGTLWVLHFGYDTEEWVHCGVRFSLGVCSRGRGLILAEGTIRVGRNPATAKATRVKGHEGAKQRSD